MYFFKFLKSAILSSAAAVSTQAVSESAGDLVSTIQHPNFQHIYLITDRDARSFEARLIFQAGGLDNPYTEGLAHYVEHLAWLNVTHSQNFGKMLADQLTTCSLICPKGAYLSRQT